MMSMAGKIKSVKKQTRSKPNNDAHGLVYERMNVKTGSEFKL